jgi:hypothetical protein
VRGARDLLDAFLAEDVTSNRLFPARHRQRL